MGEVSESENVNIEKCQSWRLSELEIISVGNGQNWKVIYLRRDRNKVSFKFVSLGLDLPPHIYVYVPFVKNLNSQNFSIVLNKARKFLIVLPPHF